MFRNTPILLIVFLLTTGLFAQNGITTSHSLQWESQPVSFTIEGAAPVKTVSFRQAAFQMELHALPIFTKKAKLNQTGKPVVKLTNLRFETLAFTDIPNIEQHISSDIDVKVHLAFEKKQAYAMVSFVPIRLNGFGEYEKLVSFDMDLTVLPGQSHSTLAKDRTYTENSVLSQGTFYKFHVTETGIHKIDFEFLQALGITGSVNLANLRIYGNGGGMLPELAGADKYDDLVENPVKVVDNNSNNTFDAGDFVLFYAQGPDHWTFNESNNRFEHSKHLYATANAYFLNFDKGAGKRVQAASAPFSVNETVDSFDDYAFHESELSSLNQSGRVWHGEEFNAQLSQDFTFSFPNLQHNIATYLKIGLAARSTDGSTSFSITANNDFLQTVFVNSTIPGYTGDFGKESIFTSNYQSASDDITVNLTYNRSNAGQVGWLDYISLNVRRNLVFDGGQMDFRDRLSVSEGNTARFEIQGVKVNTEVWDVTHIDQVSRVDLINNGSNWHFDADASELREYIIFDGSDTYTPEPVGTIANQNLHAAEYPDMVIITHPNFIDAANELADYRSSKNSIEIKVVTIDQVYNEFSSGTPDLTAIRDYVKMYYDRAGENTELMPQHLLLFGDASYDYKGIEFGETNENFIPTYESESSLRTLNTYCTDDYYGFLDDTEGASLSTSSHLLDIAVGRFPVKTPEEGQGVVNKIKHYETNASLGDWRNILTFVADDEDSNIHLVDGEIHTDNVGSKYKNYNINKIYLDAYPQISTPGGNRYPDVNDAINNSIFSGTFMMNYIGHGGEDGWAHERILNTSDVLKWDNFDKLPLFVTATCSFSRYDDPSKTSAGEHVILSPTGGAVAIVTTVRLVFASSNEKLNTTFLNQLFEPDSDGQIPTIGEITRRAKNDPLAAATGVNNRKFVLLGDPSMILAYPAYDIRTTSINETPIGSGTIDTLKALTKVDVSGEVTDQSGNLLENFEGVVYPTVFDKKVNITTLKNDEKSLIADFEMWKNVIFKGKAQVQNGKFNFSFIVPKDINYQFGTGRISYYADDSNMDASGYTQDLVIGGIADEVEADDQGPQVDVFMNDEKFVIGGLTDSDPTLLVKLRDDNGINTTGIGIGHDITALLDDNQQNIIVLNDHYQAALDSYQEGEIRFPLSDLEEGLHTIFVKAWDVHNNSGKGYTEFVVAESAEIALQNVLNYPNPFTDQTAFWFEHNRAGENLRVTVQVYTMSGRLVKTIHEEILADGNRVDNIFWDGLDDFGNKIGRGVYIYKLTVRGSDDHTANHMERLVILK